MPVLIFYDLEDATIDHLDEFEIHYLHVNLENKDVPVFEVDLRFKAIQVSKCPQRFAMFLHDCSKFPKLIRYYESLT